MNVSARYCKQKIGPACFAGRYLEDTVSITAAQVNELRKATGAGLMDCKKALAETGGDQEKAVDYLRDRKSVV